ncbi:unnamed protein product, partial [Ilex paraguariensis]
PAQFAFDESQPADQALSTNPVHDRPVQPHLDQFSTIHAGSGPILTVSGNIQTS